MDQFQDDSYRVFVRIDGAHSVGPEANEEPLADCVSYEEARRVKLDSHRDCVIRFSGNVGGGD